MKKIFLAIAAVLAFSLTLVSPVSVYAEEPASTGTSIMDKACEGEGSSGVLCQNKDNTVDSVISTVINTLLFIVGILSVVMIIVGGLRYTASAGNANAVTGAKNTITYAVVGLVVSMVAFVVVNWVQGRF